MRSSLILQRAALTLACAAFVGCTNDHDAVGSDPAAAAAAVAAPPPERSAAPPRLPEACNALDDNGDGVADEGQTCAAACTSDALAKAAASIRLPRDGDVTVPEGSAETPALLAIQQLPEFCLGSTPRSTSDDVTVGCGEVLAVGRRGITASTLRVAPGGVVRIKEDALIDLRDEILVCPGAIIESGADLVEQGSGRDGAAVELRTERLIMLGKIGTRGGWVPESGRDRPGNSGRLRVTVDRLLFSGVIDTAEVPPRGYRSGEGGDVTIVVTKESFFSGSVRSGGAFVQLPVCCH